MAHFDLIGGSGGPDLIAIVAAAGALGAIVGEFLRGAEAGTDSMTLTDGLGPGGILLTRGDAGFAPDRAASVLDEMVQAHIRAAAHFGG